MIFKCCKSTQYFRDWIERKSFTAFYVLFLQKSYCHTLFITARIDNCQLSWGNYGHSDLNLDGNF